MISKKQIIFYLVIVIAVAGIAVFGLSQSKDEKKQTANQITQTAKPAAAAKPEQSSANGAGVTIKKSDITSTAKYYPITVDNTYMEVIAVKSNDGKVRTALNTCQVCYDSGRGYYVQTGDVLVCQNCKNRFRIDQVEVVKGGCNPVPVLAENKTDNGNEIIIPQSFLKTQKSLFLNWKK